MNIENVLIIGASNKPERYSYKAMKLLGEYGHKSILLHPNLENIEGRPVLHEMSEIDEPIDTVTLYINPKILGDYITPIKELSPKRVIFNPGTENDQVKSELEASGILCEYACTLVLLRTEQF